MWTITDGETVRIHPELLPECINELLARDTLAAVRRFYTDPENRKRFEVWKAERCAQKSER